MIRWQIPKKPSKDFAPVEAWMDIIRCKKWLKEQAPWCDDLGVPITVEQEFQNCLRCQENEKED